MEMGRWSVQFLKATRLPAISLNAKNELRE
jgi:hypothetical protein